MATLINAGSNCRLKSTLVMLVGVRKNSFQITPTSFILCFIQSEKTKSDQGVQCCRANWLTVALLAFATGPASAADLRAGEYACAGSSGILIGLGFLLNADGSYTDLNRKNSGRVAFEGSSVKFIGGHLNGYVGNNVRGGSNFEIHGISCSHN